MKTTPTNIDSENTFSGRLASAFVSLVFSLPVCAVFWLLVNLHLAGTDYVPAKFMFYFIGTLATIGFAFPKSFPTLLGRFCELVLALFSF